MKSNNPGLMLWMLHMIDDRREMVWRYFAAWCARQVMPLLPREMRYDAHQLSNAIMFHLHGMDKQIQIEYAAEKLSEKYRSRERGIIDAHGFDAVTKPEELGIAAAYSATHCVNFDEPSNAACETLCLTRAAVFYLRKDRRDEFDRCAATELRALAGNPFLLIEKKEAHSFLQLLRTSVDCDAAHYVTYLYAPERGSIFAEDGNFENGEQLM